MIMTAGYGYCSKLMYRRCSVMMEGGVELGRDELIIRRVRPRVTSDGRV